MRMTVWPCSSTSQPCFATARAGPCAIWSCSPASAHRPRDAEAAMDAGTDAIRIRQLDTLGERDIEGLSQVLIDCVEGGASVSFMLPMTQAKAATFWRRTGASLARGDLRLLAAEDATQSIIGTVQLLLDQPENQPHRGAIGKMLVHRRARRRGVGAALLSAAEQLALSLGKTLLVLDT